MLNHSMTLIVCSLQGAFAFCSRALAHQISFFAEYDSCIGGSLFGPNPMGGGSSKAINSTYGSISHLSTAILGRFHRNFTVGSPTDAGRNDSERFEFSVSRGAGKATWAFPRCQVSAVLEM
jgi:hypothetical protein